MPAVSTPSTQTFAPNSEARPAKYLMSSLSTSSSSTRVTKPLSILMISKGRSLTMLTEEKPVPKSSSATRMPLDLRFAMTFLRRSISRSLHLSVTSKQRCSGGYSISSRIRNTISTKSGFSSWVYERLMFITKSGFFFRIFLAA